MGQALSTSPPVRFGVFEVDLRAGELRKSGIRLKFTGQPMQVLAILLERPGELVTREELRRRLWPDTTVDFEHNLNTAINKVREVLGDSAESPRFVETLPRRGYRFIAPVNGATAREIPAAGQIRAGEESALGREQQRSSRVWLLAALLLVTAVGIFMYKALNTYPSTPRSLTRVTFDEGLQFGATWSPDARYIAYASDRGGKLDIWVQQVSGGDPIQITKGPGDNWAPNWSPDGKYIAFRSDEDAGGLFVIPALGGGNWKRKIAPFGYYPRWSPDGSQILFQSTELSLLPQNRFYVADTTGAEPHEIPMGFLKGFDTAGVSAAWFPDGKRISVWTCESLSTYLGLWTQPIAGGTAIKSEMSPVALKQIQSASQGLGIMEWALDFGFAWAPSRRAIYAERTFRGTKNIWRMTVDPQSLRILALDRLTTGPGSDTELSLSPDGKKLAFTGGRQQVRAWMFPFDASRGRLMGQGKPVSAAGVHAWDFALSPDGNTLIYRGDRVGKWELWETSLADGRSWPIAADDTYSRELPQWSRDGKHVAYFRVNGTTDEAQLIDWSPLTREERVLPLPKTIFGVPYDWTPDGKRLLVSRENTGTGRAEIWAVPAAVTAQTEKEGLRVVSDPVHDLWQSHFSPDGRWIVFEATSPTSFASTIYVVSSLGGPTLRVTDGEHWDDKPRWSPDGKIIYFISNRSGFYNVFGVHFDPAGKNRAEPFQVSHFDSRALMIPKQIESMELSLSKNRLVVTLSEASGSIWMLDHVDQ